MHFAFCVNINRASSAPLWSPNPSSKTPVLKSLVLKMRFYLYGSRRLSLNLRKKTSSRVNETTVLKFSTVSVDICGEELEITSSASSHNHLLHKLNHTNWTKKVNDPVYCTLPDISSALWFLDVCPAMALIWMKFAPVRKGTQARISKVSCQLWMKATMTAMHRAQIVFVARPNLDPAA